MAVQVTNQKPNKLDPVYIPSFKGDYDLKKYMSKVFEPTLRLPLVPSAPVDIAVNGSSVTDSQIYDLMLSCEGDTIINVPAEDDMRSLFNQCLAYYDKDTKLLFKDLFAVSSGVESGLDEPSPVVIYNPSVDIIPAATGFIAGNMSYDEFFATFAYYCRFNAFGAYFVNETAFNDFKTWFQSQVNLIQNKMPVRDQALLNDFMTMTLSGLTESFKIRYDETDNIHEYSFARVLIAELMIYFGNTSLAGIMPFDTFNLFMPKNVIFINVEKFAHANAKAIKTEVDDINKAIDLANIKMVSNNRLQRLAPMARQLRKSQSMAIMAAQAKAPPQRAQRTQFKSRVMSKSEYLKLIAKILEKMKTDKLTQNVYKSVKTSFAKPNRRDPDNYNLMGKIVSTKYRPDIHLYLDTSGSISEENYEASVKLAIQLAKKLNVNLYFNTFSHIMSQTSLLRCENKSVSQIYKTFQNTPKVTGGTDFEQIWHFINASKKRQDELSIMITDFEWGARSAYIKHPKNLYYMPCANMDWKQICNAASYFVKSCEHNDPNIRQHILA